MELWRKNLYVLWVAQFITIMGMSSVVPFLPFFIRELGVTDPESVARWSGIVFAGPFFLSFIFTPIWGALGDRYGRKLMVVRAVIGLGIAQILVGLSQSVEQLLFFRMIQGAVSGFIPAAITLVSASAPRERTGYALGVLQMSLSAGTLFGPLMGGFLADIVGYRPIFFTVAALCFLSGILIITLVKEKTEPQPKEKKHTLLENYKYAFSTAQIAIALLIIFLAQSSMSMVQPVFALFIEKIYDNPLYLSTVAGALFSVMGLFMLFSSPWWGNKNDLYGYRKYLPIAIGLAAMMLFLQALSTAPWHVAISRAFLGFAMGGIMPALYSFVSKQTPLSRRGGIMGIATSFTILSNMIGPSASGFIAAHYGIRAALHITAVVTFLALIVVIKYIKEPAREGME